MSILWIWIVYFIIVITALLPLLRIDLFLSSKKYQWFLHVTFCLIFWGIITGMRWLLLNTNQLYYLSLLIYPTVLLTIILLFYSVTRFLDIHLKSWIKYGLIVLWLVDFIMSMTNQYHRMFIVLLPSEMVELSTFVHANTGIGFLVHTIISYLMIVVTFYLLMRHFIQNMRYHQDRVPVILLAVSAFFGIIINMVHIFVYTFNIDPSLIFFIFFMNVLYFVIYIRDLRLIFMINNNHYILERFREMYLIVDTKGYVVDASDELLSIFDFTLETPKTYETIYEIMSEKAIIYTNADELPKTYDSEKIYLHMQESKINLPFFTYSGRFFLFYDESNNRKLVSQMDYLLSHDQLSNLYNRTHLESIRSTYDYHQKKYGVIMIDMDGLKLYNDYLGHKEGDDVIVEFSRILKQISEEESSVMPFRIGGDEFMLIIENFSENKALSCIEKIHQAVSKRERALSFSYGYSAKERDEETLSNVMKRADQKLYKMKSSRGVYKESLKQYLKNIPQEEQ